MFWGFYQKASGIKAYHTINVSACQFYHAATSAIHCRSNSQPFIQIAFDLQVLCCCL